VESQEESLQVLTGLGLTVLEAKVYLTLVRTDETSAKTISKASNVSQPDVYRVLSMLENHGLIERIIAIPHRFKATPIDKGIAILLQRRDNQSALLHKKATELVQSYEGKSAKTTTTFQEEAAHFILVPGVHVHRIRNAVDNAQSNVLCFTTLDMFRKVRFITEDVWKRGVKRGVKYQFLIGKPHDEEVTLDLDPALENNGNFEIKFMRASSPCIVLIDKTEVFLRTEMNIEAPVLWSDNACIVAMIENYFEMLWKTPEEQH
jgi:sugar-specific transcriptional regulator TrmB